MYCIGPSCFGGGGVDFILLTKSTVLRVHSSSAFNLNLPIGWRLRKPAGIHN